MSDSVAFPNTALSLDSAQDFPFTSLLQILEHCFDMHCHFPALNSGDRVISYYQLDEASTAFAAYLQKWVNPGRGEKIAITSHCTLYGAVAFCGAIRAGISVVFPESSSVERQSHIFSENRVRLLVAMKSDLFNSQYLKRFFVPEEQVMTLDRLGRIERVEKFSAALCRVSPADWQRPLLSQQKKLEVFLLSKAGLLSGISQKSLLSQVQELHQQSQSSSDGDTLGDVNSFLKILVQLLQGQRIDF